MYASSWSAMLPGSSSSWWKRSGCRLKNWSFAVDRSAPSGCSMPICSSCAAFAITASRVGSSIWSSRRITTSGRTTLP